MRPRLIENVYDTADLPFETPSSLDPPEIERLLLVESISVNIQSFLGWSLQANTLKAEAQTQARSTMAASSLPLNSKAACWPKARPRHKPNPMADSHLHASMVTHASGVGEQPGALNEQPAAAMSLNEETTSATSSNEVVPSSPAPSPVQESIEQPPFTALPSTSQSSTSSAAALHLMEPLIETPHEVANSSTARMRAVIRRMEKASGRFAGSLVKQRIKHIRLGMQNLVSITDTSNLLDATRSGNTRSQFTTEAATSIEHSSSPESEEDGGGVDGARAYDHAAVRLLTHAGSSDESDIMHQQLNLIPS